MSPESFILAPVFHLVWFSIPVALMSWLSATKALKIPLWLASKHFNGLARAADLAFRQIYVLIIIISLLLLPCKTFLCLKKDMLIQLQTPLLVLVATRIYRPGTMLGEHRDV